MVKSLKKLKVGFIQKVMAKFSNLSNRHACEPKIVSDFIFPVNYVNIFMGISLNKFS